MKNFKTSLVNKKIYKFYMQRHRLYKYMYTAITTWKVKATIIGKTHANTKSCT